MNGLVSRGYGGMVFRAKFTILFCAVVFIGCIRPAESLALDYDFKNGVLRLSGPIAPDEVMGFKAILNEIGPQTIESLQLSSSGGNIGGATEMARIIRKNGYTTFVDAKTDRCASSCTILFVAGVRRHYLNAGTLVDHVEKNGGRSLGLQFHNARDLILGRWANSGIGTGVMISAYYEFGVGRARDLIEKADTFHLFVVSEKTALDAGVATDLDDPRKPASGTKPAPGGTAKKRSDRAQRID